MNACLPTLQNAQELRARGVPRDAIHFIYPSSHKSIEENAEAVRASIRGDRRDRSESLVVVAHSRGACDTLAFALENPQFVRTRVRGLFLVQGPFGGTGVADYVAGEGSTSLDPQIPFATEPRLIC